MDTLKHLFYFSCLLFTLIGLTSCSSNGYTGGSVHYSTGLRYDNYYRHGWSYDNYYRSRVNNHYNRSEARARIRSEAGNRNIGGGQQRGGRGGGRR